MAVAFPEGSDLKSHGPLPIARPPGARQCGTAPVFKRKTQQNARPRAGYFLFDERKRTAAI
jgi:hypothetical protein